MDYITSRKKIYAPVYAELVRQQPAFVELKNSIEAGENIQILDIDGPTGGYNLQASWSTAYIAGDSI